MAQLVLALIVGLALLTWIASGVVETTAQGWFERDVDSRSKLVLTGARQSLIDAWYGEPRDLLSQLVDLARDERVMGVSVCNADLTLRARTEGFPDEFSCSIVGSRARTAGDASNRLHEWSTVATLPTGRVYVSVMPLETGENSWDSW